MKKIPMIGDQVRVKNEMSIRTVVGYHMPASGYRRIILDGGLTLPLDQIVTPYQKYVRVYVVQGHYGQGWEDVTEEETRKEGRARYKEYCNNDPNPIRMISRLEPNELYKG